MNFNDVVNEFYDSVILADNNEHMIKRSVGQSGSYKRYSYRYWYFAHILTNREVFLKVVYQNMIADIQHYKDVELDEVNFYFSCIKSSISYLQNHNMNDNITNFVVASHVIIEYFYRKNIFSMIYRFKKVTIYDIARLYMIYLTINKYKLHIDKHFYIMPSNVTIEFGKINLQLPLIAGKMLTPVEVIDYMQDTELREYLNETDINHVRFKMTIFKHSNDSAIYNPTLEDIEKTIKDMEISEEIVDDFIILEAKNPINNCTFIQTFKEEDGFYIEAQFREKISEKKEVLHQYGTFIENIDAVIQLFQSFILEISPITEDWEMAHEDIDVIQNSTPQKRQTYRGFKEKYLSGQAMIDTYGEAFYCPKCHRANVTNLTLKCFLECQKISKEKSYRIFDNGLECHVFDNKTDNEIFYFGYYFITDEDLSVYESVNIIPIDTNSCPNCNESMKIYSHGQKGIQGFLKCPHCKHKIDILLLGYRTYNTQFGKCKLKTKLGIM